MVTVSKDGKLIPAEAASVSIFDRGFLYGDGAFEVLRTWDGVAVELEAHLDRLADTANFLSLPVDRALVERAVKVTLEAAGSGDHRVRIVVTRGCGTADLPISLVAGGQTIVVVDPLPAQPAEISVALVDAPLPGSFRRGWKTLAYLDHLVAKALAHSAGADEALRLDATGAVAEGAMCNVFVVTEGRVRTPHLDSGALPGIVRARVIELCEGAGIDVASCTISVPELGNAEEVFVTSSLRGVVPVTRVDGRLRTAGPISKAIRAMYASRMRTLAADRAT